MRTNLQFSERLIEAVEALHGTTDKRAVARYFVAVTHEAVPSAERIMFHVLLPNRNMYATLGVYGYQHHSSTLLIEPDSKFGLTVHRRDQLWARTPAELAALYDFPDDGTLSYQRTRILYENARNSSHGSAIVQPAIIRGQFQGTLWVENSSQASAFSTNDRLRISQISVLAAHMLINAPQATIFNRDGLTEVWQVAPTRADESPIAPETEFHRSSHDRGGRAPVLSVRERDVLDRISRRLSNAQIANDLHVSVNTVRTHRRNLMSKLEAHSVMELLENASEFGLVTLSSSLD